jgi:GNAT superfamily N-acetyltransferase
LNTSDRFVIQPATPDTLPDLVALVPDREDAARRLAALRERLASGQFSPGRSLILRSGRGVEGHAGVPELAQIPVFPHFRPDTPPEAVTALARAILEGAAPGQRLVLTDAFAPLTAAPLEAAGWSLEDRHVIYETDLRARFYQPDPHARAVDASRPDLSELLGHLGRPAWNVAEGWTLFALPDADGSPAALGAVGPGGRPDTAGMDLIGVLPSWRGRGLGTRLHAHLLGWAAERFTRHSGGTEADNHTMRRIFEKHGSQLVATQLYFRAGARPT